MLLEEIQSHTNTDVCLTIGLETAKNIPVELCSFEVFMGGNMWDFMAVTKALADENRVRLLLALLKQELCVCQLIELLGLAPSTVSKHMSILRSARLVEARKDGRWMYYRIAGASSSPTVRGAIEWARKSLADDSQIIADEKRLEQIRKMDTHKLCESQCSPKTKSKKPMRNR